MQAGSELRPTMHNESKKDPTLRGWSLRSRTVVIMCTLFSLGLLVTTTVSQLAHEEALEQLAEALEAHDARSPATGPAEHLALSPVVEDIADTLVTAEEGTDTTAELSSPGETQPAAQGSPPNSSDLVQQAQDSSRQRILLIGLAALLVVMTTVMLAADRLFGALTGLVADADRLGQGDLATAMEQGTGREVSHLAGILEGLRLQLREVLSEATAQADEASDAARGIAWLLSTCIGEAEAEAEKMQSTVESIGEFEQAVRAGSDKAAMVNRIASDGSSSCLSIDLALREMLSRTDELTGSAQTTDTAVALLRTNAERINRSAQELSEQGQLSSKALGQIARSLRGVQSDAQKSARLTDHFRSQAQQTGMDSVQKTAIGMREIERAVDQASSFVEKLGSRSEQIGTVLNVIKDISGKTRLLALNASIIATQAGEHGRSFAVVAREINGLAERTRISTEEIQQTVVGIQEDVDATTKATEHGRRRVQEGVKLTSAALEALEAIASGADEAASMADQINQATARQGTALAAVTETVERTSVMIHDIVSATREQYRETQVIDRASSEVQEASRRMRKRVGEQSLESESAKKSNGVLADHAGQINRLNTAQSERSARIRKTIHEIQRLADTKQDRFAELSEKVSRLRERARRAEQRGRRFVI